MDTQNYDSSGASLTPKIALTNSISNNSNSAVRRSMRETKRPKFDDELVQSIPLSTTTRKKNLNERQSPELFTLIDTVKFYT